MTKSDPSLSFYRKIRMTLLFICLPICVSVLFCGICSTYITINSWNCKTFANSSNSGNNFMTKSKDSNCNTIIDKMSSKVMSFIPNRRLVLCLRTASIYNTLMTYLSPLTQPIHWLCIHCYGSLLSQF